MVELITVLAGLAKDSLRMLPDYDQRKEEEFDAKLNYYLQDINSERPDHAKLAATLDWLRSYGKEAIKL